jgi:hypothetical protein
MYQVLVVTTLNEATVGRERVMDLIHRDFIQPIQLGTGSKMAK